MFGGGEISNHGKLVDREDIQNEEITK